MFPHRDSKARRRLNPAGGPLLLSSGLTIADEVTAAL
jgi:hypothetical protein